MDKFDLTFNGEILSGQNLAEVKVRFAKAFLIDDAERVESFFSGNVVTLRRNLDKDAAEAFYTRMHRLGVVLRLETVQPGSGISKAGKNQEFRKESPGSIEQSWPVRTTPSKPKKQNSDNTSKPGNAVIHAQEAAAKEEHLQAKKIMAEQVAAREQAASEEKKRKAEELAARKKVKEEAARKKAEEVAARKKAADEERKRKAEELAARKKVKEEAAKKKAEEVAARKKAAAEQKRIKAEQIAARKKIREETARKKAEEVAARKRAAEEKRKKKEQELAARKKAREEAALLKAQKEEARARAKEEQRQKKAKEEEALRIAAETARQKQAEEEENRRISEELAARKEAQEAAKKLAAQKKADEEAAIEKALADIARKKAEEEEAEIQRALALLTIAKEKEKETRLLAKLAEQKRLHAEQAAKAKKDEERIEEALRELTASRKTAASTLALKNREKKEEQAAIEAARLKQDKQNRLNQALQRDTERRQEQAAKDRAAEGAARLKKLQCESVKSTEAEKKPAVSATPQRPKRGKPGAAPNIFSLQPFRSTAAIRDRADQSRQLMKVMYLASLATLLILLILGLRFIIAAPPPNSIVGPRDITIGVQSSVFVTAADQLYVLDRAGVARSTHTFAELGLNSGARLLGTDQAGNIIFQEKLPQGTNINTGNTSDSQVGWRLLRCEPSGSPPSCSAYPAALADKPIESWVTNSRTGNIYVATPSLNLLVKIGSDDTVLGSAEVTMPGHPSMALSDGLLYMNGAGASEVRIFRLDNDGFGEQLDVVLLVPPLAQSRGHTQLHEILHNAETWWVSMLNPETGNIGLYLFDSQWNFISSVTLAPDSFPDHMVSWADKVLVLDTNRLSIQRFNANGEAEPPLTLIELDSRVEKQLDQSRVNQKLWQIGVWLLVLICVSTYTVARIQQLRALVYKHGNVVGAAPLDDKAQHIHWLALEESKSSALMKLAGVYALMSLAILTGLIYLVVPIGVFLAAVFVMLGPAIALGFLHFSRPGHIGVLKDELVLVDHGNRYHTGSGARIHYWGNFLLLDDIAVFVGSRYLPVFSRSQLHSNVAPLALAGVKVDWKTGLVRLIQNSHPVARGFLACLVCIVIAVVCLLVF